MITVLTPSAASVKSIGEDYLELEVRGKSERYQWRSENGSSVPSKLLLIDDTCTADNALKLARSGTSLLWTGDFQNARHLLQAMSRRLDKRSKLRPGTKNKVAVSRQDSHQDSHQVSQNLSSNDISLAKTFEAFREDQKSRAQLLGKLLIPINADHKIELKRAPDITLASAQAYGADIAAYIVSLRELQGVISAFEWRKKGVNIDLSALGISPFKLTPHFGVFSPIRGEYLKLLATTPLPKCVQSNSCALDIGTGTGVLAIILALRGVQKVIATDQSPRAIACALANVQAHNLESKITVLATDLFPLDTQTKQPIKAALIVCNPPWLPGPSSGALDSAVFDPQSQMLKGFLSGLGKHLLDQGQGWLILSDLAEHLGLRTRAELMQWIEDAGLQVLGRLDVRPEHKKANDVADPFYKARSLELTSLWRLGIKA